MPNVTVNRLIFKTDDKDLLNKIKAEIAGESTDIDFNKIIKEPELRDYGNRFTIYHIVYRLVDLGITRYAEDFLPRKCIGCYSGNIDIDPITMNVINGKYSDTISEICKTLNDIAKPLCGEISSIKEELLKRIKIVHNELMLMLDGHDDSFLTRYNRYNFESVVKRNSIYYFKLFLKYGIIDSFLWRITYWNTKWNSYDTRWIDDNTLEFYTAWNPVISIIDNLQRKYNVDLEYCFIKESMPDSPERWSTMDGYLVQDELSLEEEEKLIKILFELE